MMFAAVCGYNDTLCVLGLWQGVWRWHAAMLPLLKGDVCV